MDEQLTIGQVAARTGVATSALRFYEDRRLIRSVRTEGNQRRYSREVIRVVSVIRAAQELGISLGDIGEALETLPGGRTPTASDWERLAEGWRSRLDQRVKALIALRDDLSECIGCGCLSLESCSLLNPGDRASTSGTGARFLAGDAEAANGSP